MKVTLSENDLKTQATHFLESLSKKMEAEGLEVMPHWDIDHLCYRVETVDAFDQHKQAFSQLGELVSESQVNGRAIATFELNNPIVFEDWLVKLVELPSPKQGKKTKTGFEHCEVVVDCSLEDIVKKNPSIDWDTSGMKKIFNSELEAALGGGSVKFHHLSLKSVINFERRPKMAILVSELKLLEMFKDHQPFIAGTIPLAIDLEGADVDFLVSFADPRQFTDVCKQSFGRLPEFEISDGIIHDLPYSLCRFEYLGVPVELFCTPLSTYRQNAFLHFQIEEKLLKYGPGNWQNEVIKLKEKGMKTEPAFAKLLNRTDTDPYQLLLNLQKVPIKELRQLVRGTLN